MTRRANQHAPSAPGAVMQLAPHELRLLKLNRTRGGYQDLENWVVTHTDAAGRCELDPVHFERLVRCIKRYGSGGPNGRLRNACIPALRRIGIELQPEWTV